MTDKFDDIRPYYDTEIASAMARIAADDNFETIARYIFPHDDPALVRQRLCSYDNIFDFQSNIMTVVNERIIADSITAFTCHGLHRLDPNKSYLFISNHRDIMLDASLLQHFLLTHGYPTTEITFGANLMMSPLIIDIGKCNKMFKIPRPTCDAREFYRSLLHTSEYIRYAICEKGASVWIAQRNGRTKDGNDVTDEAVIKMLSLSNKEGKVKAINSLHIVPMAISYEWEPCDMLKAIEVYKSRQQRYVKAQGEDLNSILTGILSQKGRVHIELCREIAQQELSLLTQVYDREYPSAIAKLIDERIYNGYQLYPNNFIAHDILYHNNTYHDRYTPAERDAFINHIAVIDSLQGYDIPALKAIFLRIYANPVVNKLQ